MNDKLKTLFSCISLTVALVLPLLVLLVLLIIGLVTKWAHYDWLTMGLITVGLFALFFLISVMFLFAQKHPSLFAILLPYIIGIVYMFLPLPLVGPFDVMAAYFLGGLFTFLLWRKRDKKISPWLLLVIACVSLYYLVGFFIPTPIDEVIVILIGTGIAWWIISRTQLNAEKTHIISEEV